MTPDEVLAKLELLGIKMTRRTLLNYEKWGLLPEPVRGGFGRGKGNFTHYPEETVWQAYAAWRMLNDKLNPHRVQAVYRGRFLVMSQQDIGLSVSSPDGRVSGEWRRFAMWGKIGIPVNATELFLYLETNGEPIADNEFTQLIKDQIANLDEPNFAGDVQEVYFIFIDEKNGDHIYIVKWNKEAQLATRIFPL